MVRTKTNNGEIGLPVALKLDEPEDHRVCPRAATLTSNLRLQGVPPLWLDSASFPPRCLSAAYVSVDGNGFDRNVE